jgi:hypothetical protein
LGDGWGVVGALEGGGPGVGGGVGVVLVGPAAVVFEVVVSLAGGCEVVGVGGSAEVPVADVVEF